MCFSAEASFAASAAICAIGTLSVAKAKQARQLPFAGIPLIFSVQQAIEGLLWIALRNPEYAAWQSKATYSFLFFAQLFWPFWVPLATLLLETDPRRARILKGFLGLGILVSLYFAYRQIFHAAHARIDLHHITYDLDFPYHWVILAGTVYVIVTLAPPLISSVRRMAVFGVAMVFSFAISLLFYFNFVTSVWCFFAALVSVIIFYIVRELPPRAAVRLPG